ncbi:hypothetical protein AT15_06005 [Kosmotoga arenicorallina S304]|uniref:DUF1868 domain-containing protein n=1 Tax=Kosmotoga arenicorallina S304 TaxID=1453497 RepID=A0A182C7M1_9BACT|nr:hypothetical protein [Kosmotoga arenicorallina]OAA31624.1 hypothetical protein AT15_06005 [Kosmotoga arenicorallina S304]
MDLLKNVQFNEAPLDYQDYLSYLMNEKNSTDNFLRNLASWHITPNLTKKVNSKGKYIPFKGDTTVFPVKSSEIFENIQEKLYQKGQKALATPLKPEYFHITLHDLNNEIDIEEAGKLERLIKETGILCQKIFGELAFYLNKYPDQGKIHLKSIGFMGPPIGIAVLFAPESEKDFRILMNLFSLFQKAVKLNKPLKPHLSLGYFLPKEPQYEEKLKLLEFLDKMPNVKIELNLWELSYQEFTDMNTYITKFQVKEFM